MGQSMEFTYRNNYKGIWGVDSIMELYVNAVLNEDYTSLNTKPYAILTIGTDDNRRTIKFDEDTLYRLRNDLDIILDGVRKFDVE